MESTLKIAYKEVNEILNLLGNEYKSKIPPKVLKLFEQNGKEEAKIFEQNDEDEIKMPTNVNNIKISRKALIIISILNIKYWTNDDEKEFLKKQYAENEKKYKEKVNLYKQNTWQKKEKVESSNVALIETNKNSIIVKIKNFLYSLIDRRKRE